MAKITDIIERIESFAPLESAMDWDNSGWQIKLDENNEVKKVLLAISPTIDVIEQAISENFDLLVTHHPLIFDGIKNISIENPIEKTIIKAIQNNLQIYAAHTNLDTAKGGVNDTLAVLIGLENIEIYEDFVQIGEIKQEISAEDFAKHVKKVLNANSVNLINFAEKTSVKKVAVCGGAGAAMIQKLKDKGIDMYITGDVKYHQAVLAVDFAVIDAGHLETELPVLKVLQKELLLSSVEVSIAEESIPWKVL